MLENSYNLLQMHRKKSVYSVLSKLNVYLPGFHQNFVSISLMYIVHGL